MQKLGINNNHFDNQYTLAGTHYEHRILESLGIPMELDKQVIVEELLLRVNLDGNTEDFNYECKTVQADRVFKMPKKYINQVQVQMFASGLRKTKIIVYRLNAEDYNNFFHPIDPARRMEFEVDYDENWINTVFLPKLKILADCLRKGVMPNGI